MSFQGEIDVSLGWNWSDGAVDSGRLACAQRLLEGNGANQAEAVWHVEDQTLPNGEAVTFDLSALGRTILGDEHTVTLLTVKALLIVSHATSGGRLLVGGAAADQWSEPFGADGDQFSLPPDSPLLLANLADGWIVDSANRNLLLAAVGGDVIYSIAVLGTTTAPGSGSGSGV